MGIQAYPIPSMDNFAFSRSIKLDLGLLTRQKRIKDDQNITGAYKKDAVFVFVKGWLAIAKLKPLSLLISGILMLILK